jgi:hypothetical protein
MPNDNTPSDRAQTERIELVTQEPMVNWLGPGQLLQTGLRAAIAATFGSYADGRQMQAALIPPATNPPLDFTLKPTVWLDFVADTGDGWDSSYSIAYSISRDTLSIPDVPEALPRADLLVLGGDQVYPTPAQSGYRTRFLDPFRSAFPADVPPKNPPEDPKLVAIPGNHDWYDGLHGFVQLFCTGQYVGRWKTIQRTSYYALQLPHGWWLWGLDLQLESEIDAQQFAYFEDIAHSRLQPGDQIILVTPEPTWIDESERLHRQAGGNLSELERQAPRFRSLQCIEELIAQSPARLAVVLAGDLHHYARYAPCEETSADTPHRITCGGGGAFLLGTHDLPKALHFTSGHGKQHYKLSRTFPDAQTSRKLRDQAWKLPLKNPAFCCVLAAIYLLYVWVLQSASKVPNAGLNYVTLMQYLSLYPITLSNFFSVLPLAVFRGMTHSPSAVLLTLAVISGTGAFTASSATERKGRAWIGGAIHGLLHLALALLLLWSAGRFNLGTLAPRLGYSSAAFVDHPLQVLLFIIEASVLGGALGGLLFGFWLLMTNRLFHWHQEEVFSSQGIADYKSILRMRLDEAGLTIYPLKIRQVCRKWKLGPGIEQLRRVGRAWRLRASPGRAARFEPVNPIVVELIEDPISVPTKPSEPVSQPCATSNMTLS